MSTNPRSLTHRTAVAIVGGGFSGTMLAAQLARRSLPSVLIDGTGRIGQGTAYATGDPAHLLNIPAERMSAWPDDAEDFARIVETEGGLRTDFVQRRRYGQYTSAILDQAKASGLVVAVAASAIAAERSGATWTVSLSDGSTIVTDALALAVGNQPPHQLAAFAGAGPRFVADPWGPTARAAIAALADSGGDALVIGTGLSMVDLALSLDAAGHRGRMIAVSRRGLVPRASTPLPGDRAAANFDDVPLGSIRGLTRWVRARSARIGWREAVDSLRPLSHQVWQSLPLDQQQRFLRHARPWWDVHRHRIAPQVDRIVTRMIAGGRLEVMAGRIESVAPSESALHVRILPRGGGEPRELRAAVVFNSTGPLHAISKTGNPLLRGLLDRGEASPDALGIGFAVDARDRPLGSTRLWALGSLTKARYWEIIAVPDIREQAARVAADIAKELDA